MITFTLAEWKDAWQAEVATRWPRWRWCEVDRIDFRDAFVDKHGLDEIIAAFKQLRIDSNPTRPTIKAIRAILEPPSASANTEPDWALPAAEATPEERAAIRRRHYIEAKAAGRQSFVDMLESMYPDIKDAAAINNNNIFARRDAAMEF